VNQGDERNPVTMNTTRIVHDDTDALQAELRRLRDKLADAWWYEEPLEVIEQLEADIRRCRGLLDRG
jgi:hypothetical protein